jgi:DNA-binding Lrp family transcriptional regulator
MLAHCPHDIQAKNFLQAFHAFPLYTKPPKPLTKKSRKRPWESKNLPDEWLKFARQELKWKALPKKDQRIVQLFWPERHCLLSYEEIARLCRVSRMQAIRIMQEMIEAGIIEKEHEFLERRGKKTKIHKRNYYVLTELGRKKLEELVREFFPEENGKMLPRKDLTKVRKDCQDKNELSTEKEKFEGTEKEYHEFLEKRFAEIVAEKESLNPAVTTLFDAHGFKSHFSTLCPHFLKKLNEASLKQLVKALKLVEKKVKKGFRIRNFWAFFRYVLENKTNCWLTKRANDYKQAIEKKTKLEGVDSQTVVEQIIKLQERTGQEAKGEELRGLLCFGASHLSALLKVVNFKLNITPVKNWIGYVFFLAKKPIMELANVYKSEKRIQAEKEFATGKKVDDKTAWDNYFTHCDERLIFRALPMREIWDCG